MSLLPPGICPIPRIGEANGQIRRELYQLEEDPEELRKMAEIQPDRADQMSRALEEWQRSVVSSLKGMDYQQPVIPSHSGSR